MTDVADGLSHLHSRNVVHGDLKGVGDCSETCPIIALTPNQPSILVDNFGRARITDFGLATVIQNRDSIGSGSDEDGPTARWIAPETLNDDQGSYGKPADIFAFAMVIIEVRYG